MLSLLVCCLCLAPRVVVAQASCIGNGHSLLQVDSSVGGKKQVNEVEEEGSSEVTLRLFKEELSEAVNSLAQLREQLQAVQAKEAASAAEIAELRAQLQAMRASPEQLLEAAGRPSFVAEEEREAPQMEASSEKTLSLLKDSESDSTRNYCFDAALCLQSCTEDQGSAWLGTKGTATTDPDGYQFPNVPWPAAIHGLPCISKCMVYVPNLNPDYDGPYAPSSASLAALAWIECFGRLPMKSKCKVGDKVKAFWDGDGNKYGATLESKLGSKCALKWDDNDPRFRDQHCSGVYKDDLPCF